MTDKGLELRTKIEDIKMRLKTNQITYDEAKIEAEPVIDEINKIGAEVAKKFGKKPIKLNFIGLMR